MKSKSSMTITISLIFFISLGVFAYFYLGEDVPSQSQASPKNSPDNQPKQSGHLWFSNVPLSDAETKVNTDLYGIGADLNGKTVSQYVLDLYDLANKGDARAAYDIYLAETICADLPKRQRELANIPVNYEETYVESLQKLVKNSQDVCVNFNVSPRERIYYLNIAAKGGNVPAMMAFVREVPEGIDPLKPIDPNDSRAVQWQKDSFNYMTQAAKKGDIVALLSLSTIYAQGDLQPKNIPLALTYELAAQMLRNPNASIPDNAPQISRLTSKLTTDQIAKARSDATALVKSANTN